MLARIIFCSAVVLATLVVIILAVVSPVIQKRAAKNNAGSRLAFSLYIQQPVIADPNSHPVAPSNANVLIFRRILTEGPANTSRVVGKAQGFIIPLERFADSAFNIIYLTFDTHEHSGSISIEAKNLPAKNREELEFTVVGGTGSYAFARGLAVFSQTDSHSSSYDALYHIKLHLEYPDRSRTNPG